MAGIETPYLEKAKSFYTFILWAVGSAVPLNLLTRYMQLKSPAKEIVGFGPAAIGLLIAPVGMYYILKSFQQQEQNKKQQWLYLLGLLLINSLALYIIFMMVTGNKPFTN
ncbi:hypothetical protein [Pontibacter sp. BAB1700]|uniref:hypothetical protein n=1 Tax=Pontibacter sp. BAB1700 TaxID=1144253 RepID=UPI00026BCD29|nr:hypothetical protein [Pontibacter sp. BAB1700]EJF11636.1 hypothetical protein O71_01937 [Pontibacter sp. BAB1700]